MPAPRKDRYNKKIIKYKVIVEDESESCDEEKEVEREEEVATTDVP